MGWQATGLALLIGYLLGSIPFGLLLTRLGGAGDLRAIGSGNIGATNVLRTGRKGLAALTLLADMLKGVAAVLAATEIDPRLAPVAAAAAFVGHCYPVWLGFRGGKGVATFIGISFALAWPIGLAFALAWLAAAFLSRISSVAGLVGSAATPVAALLLGRQDLAVLFAALLVLVVWKHRANIARLRAGTEPRIGGGS